MQYNEMLGMGYAHRLLLIDMMRGDMGQPVSMRHDDLLAYRAGHQFAEIDSRQNKGVNTVTVEWRQRAGKQLCECWEWNSWHQPPRFEKVGRGYPDCGHHFDFGIDIARVNTTRSIKFNPINTVGYLDKFPRGHVKEFVARMRGYGWGYHHGAMNSDYQNNRWYIAYQEIDHLWPIFREDFSQGHSHGMEYYRSMNFNNTQKEGEING